MSGKEGAGVSTGSRTTMRLYSESPGGSTTNPTARRPRKKIRNAKFNVFEASRAGVAEVLRKSVCGSNRYLAPSRAACQASPNVVKGFVSSSPVLVLLAGEDERISEASPQEPGVSQETGRDQGQPREPAQSELPPVAQPLQKERQEQYHPEVAGRGG